MIHRYFFIISALLILCGCHTQTYFEWPLTTQKVVKKANDNGFERHEYATRTFLLTTFEKWPAPNTADTLPAIYHIYIEGDGNSWRSRTVLSSNPTPKYPLALALAEKDPHAVVIYIARPCQYTAHSDDPLCHPKFWSSHRYAPEVIVAFQDTLDQIKKNYPSVRFRLTGFSGGASVAALLAAERDDLEYLITVAGDLNHDALNHYHHTSPLTGSLNPITIAPKLKNLTQYHFSGADDPIVPLWVAQQFVDAVGPAEHVHAIILPHTTHHRGWLAQHATIMPTH